MGLGSSSDENRIAYFALIGRLLDSYNRSAHYSGVVRQKSFDICLQVNHVRTALESRPAEHFTTESDGSGDPSAHETWFYVRLNKFITKAICKDPLDALH